MLQLDPSAPGFIDDPYPTYELLRAEEPVHYSEKLRAWVLTRYADHETFFRHPQLTADRTKAARFPGLPGPRYERSLMTDGPGYASLRKLAAGFLTVREVGYLRPKVEGVVESLLDSLDGQDEIDLVTDFAFPLPVAVIADLLGVPEEMRVHLWSWSLRQAVGMDHYNRPGRDDDDPAFDLTSYFRGLVEDRRRSPQDDFISKLVASEDGGDRLTDNEIIALCGGLLFAGHETTTNLLANGTLALLQHPEDLERLREGSISARVAVDELLRWDSPAHAISRVALADLDLGGRTIAKGDIVLGILGAMNRDPDAFDSPNTLVLDRSPNPHVAFGEGVHFCWGAPLTRLEATVAIPALLRRFGNIRLAGEPRRRATFILRGLETLPLGV